MPITFLRQAAQRIRNAISAQAGDPLTTEQVLREEAQAIHGADLSPNGKPLTGKRLNRALNELNSAALCLSGGGIRSAAFALGVIQALAVHPRPTRDKIVARAEDSLLAKFHYLSTVSGGGYIGSWLSAWTARAGFRTVWEGLVGKGSADGEESPVVGWLREHSNYLTPKIGLMSADTWAGIAVYLRNLFLIWLVILPIICLLFLSSKLFAVIVSWISQFSPLSCSSPFFAFILAALGFQIVALSCTTRDRPTRGKSAANQKMFLIFDLGSAFVASVFLTFALASPCAYVFFRNLMFSGDGHSSPFFGVVIGIGAIVYALSWLAAWPRWRSFRDYFADFIAWVLAGSVYGALMASGIYLFVWSYDEKLGSFLTPEILLLVLGVPWVIISQLLAEIIFVGITSYEDGSDADREWLGRAAGWYMVVAISWLFLAFFAFIGLDLASYLFAQFNTELKSTFTVSGLITWLVSLAKLQIFGAELKTKKVSNLVLAIVAPIFLLALAVIISALLDKILFDQSLRVAQLFRVHVVAGSIPPLPQSFYLILGAAYSALVVLFCASYFVNINRFSLHALYRNRIIRAFLGASNQRRNPNPFTDFDENDNIRVYQLWPKEIVPGECPNRKSVSWQPFHVVNIALNVVSTRKLAWQERKAEPFTASPLHSGSSFLGYRYSTLYGDPQGISLGTAVAISGAAASPNMGYHSSPVVTFALALFNVRLGWWLGNPGTAGGATFRNEGPRTAFLPFFYELFGLTTDDWKYVYLSDGGHFENLGLYEMVRRRCRYIVVSDAGCDPDFAFEDLGNAVRKIALDFGVAISFYGINSLRDRSEDGNAPICAMGTIDYGDAQDGIILYVKATYQKAIVKNVGVRSYATENPAFPHESTADQWFSESQFESYRALGFEIMENILMRGTSLLADPTHPTLVGIIMALHDAAVRDGRS